MTCKKRISRSEETDNFYTHTKCMVIGSMTERSFYPLPVLFSFVLIFRLLSRQALSAGCQNAKERNGRSRGVSAIRSMHSRRPQLLDLKKQEHERAVVKKKKDVRALTRITSTVLNNQR